MNVFGKSLERAFTDEELYGVKIYLFGHQYPDMLRTVSQGVGTHTFMHDSAMRKTLRCGMPAWI